jgi:hypothetical protein
MLARRVGHEARTKEKVVEAKEDKSCHDQARKTRFGVTGEPATVLVSKTLSKCKDSGSSGAAAPFKQYRFTMLV